jgi:TPP-dependent pyruvate/acetoin dehydrogenase alpha subunit
LARKKQAVLPDRTVLISMLRQMYQIRIFEEALYHAFMTEKMPGTMHQAIGMEAISAGVGHAMHPDDLMTSTHRGHGHAIAKHVSLDALMAEMYAKKTGASAGMGGSMHIFDLKRGFLGTTGVVGATTPIAVGAALAAQLEGKEQVVVSFFGDGASNQGVVHESLNMSAIWKLPIVFVCENNRYAVSMPVSQAMVIDHISERAAAYGIPGLTVDGNDVLAIYEAATQAISGARQGTGPTLLECESYRYKGHSRFEPATYRPQKELEAWLKRDPITQFRQRLKTENILSPEEADAVKNEVEATMQKAIDFAKQSQAATVEQIPPLVFAQFENMENG